MQFALTWAGSPVCFSAFVGHCSPLLLSECALTDGWLKFPTCPHLRHPTALSLVSPHVKQWFHELSSFCTHSETTYLLQSGISGSYVLSRCHWILLDCQRTLNLDWLRPRPTWNPPAGAQHLRGQNYSMLASGLHRVC